MKKKRKYYSLDKIKTYDAHYNLIFGERSNGKTYAVLNEILQNYHDHKKQGAYIRRWDEDITAKRMSVLLDGHVKNNTVASIFKDEGWTDTFYYSGKFYLCRYEDEKRIVDKNPFCFCFSLSAMEHDKSTSYPDITTICFDEMLTRSMYLNNEYILLMNVLSTIIRDRNDVKIYLLGNTVNKYCPYFDEFGLKHINRMKPGDIDLYEYGDTGLRMAVEYADSPSKEGKPSDVYFAFDNPSLKMITNGSWETALYPHLMMKYKPDDVIFDFFICFQEAIMHCEVVATEDSKFIFVHEKTSEIKHPDDDLIFSFDDSPKPNHRRNITKPFDKTGRILLDLFVNGLVYYQNNDVGEVVRNYLLACRNDSIIK